MDENSLLASAGCPQHPSVSHDISSGRPAFRLPVRGRHLRTFLPHRLSVFRALRPPHCQFNLFIITSTSVFSSSMNFRITNSIVQRNSEHGLVNIFIKYFTTNQETKVAHSMLVYSVYCYCEKHPCRAMYNVITCNGMAPRAAHLSSSSRP